MDSEADRASRPPPAAAAPTGGHGHERRAVALEAGEVLAAQRLVDLPPLAELGLDRQHHRQLPMRATAVASETAWLTTPAGWLVESPHLRSAAGLGRRSWS